MGRFTGLDLPSAVEIYAQFRERESEGFVGTLPQIMEWREGKTFLEYVYFIAAPEVSRIKIGYSQKEPNRRLDSLRGSAPCPLEPLGVILGDRSYEKLLHQTFEPLRTHREWYRADSALTDFIARYARPWPTQNEPTMYLDNHSAYERMSMIFDMIEEWGERRIRPIHGWPLSSEC